jgi:hypothetical protein
VSVDTDRSLRSSPKGSALGGRGNRGTRFAFQPSMPRYYFKLVDGHLVANYGAHDLENDTAAQIAAIELAS